MRLLQCLLYRNRCYLKGETITRRILKRLVNGGADMTNEEISAAIAEINSRSRSNTHRLDKQEQRQDNLDKLMKAHSKESVTETATRVVAQ